jgi:hypothetical protein
MQLGIVLRTEEVIEFLEEFRTRQDALEAGQDDESISSITPEVMHATQHSIGK